MDLSNRPKVLRGALVSLDITMPIPKVIIFHYNPETMTRTLQAQVMSEGGERSEATRLKGAPIETIKMDIEVDHTDQLEQGSAGVGIYPQLSALEMLVHPSSALVIANTVLLALGTIEVAPPAAPITFLIWGIKRILPVTIKDFSITEEAYDISLNPIRAKVGLGLRVLTYDDLSITHPGYYVYLANQIVKETMGIVASVNNMGTLGSGDVKIL